jgi:hypothetical protein
MHPTPTRPSLHRWLLLAALALTAAVYWPGLHGGFLFDDYPNIVDNPGVQPGKADLATLVNAALSSPSSEFKRPLASLSFALNYLASGLDPYWMKLTNLVIHLLNGLLVFSLARLLLQCNAENSSAGVRWQSIPWAASKQYLAPEHSSSTEAPQGIEERIGVVAVLIAAGWMLLPINLTGVLYVVQRMESMANVFVLLGLLGYVAGRRHMLDARPATQLPTRNGQLGAGGFILCVASLLLATGLGVLAKETAVMLPLYALLIEWLLFGFRQRPSATKRLSPEPAARAATTGDRRDRRIIALFLFLLAFPMVLGLAWLLPGVLNPATWANRDFTLGTRLLSEARIVSDYVLWTLLPTPGPLSFYHDNFVVSTGLLTPWTTLAGMFFLACLVALIWWLRRRLPLVSLGLGLFLGCQLLTGTILPLELIYEHRNYFASFGLLLAVMPLLAAPALDASDAARNFSDVLHHGLPMKLARYLLLAGLMLCWTALTALSAYAWGNPLRLAEDLVSRAPDSPRAQYELGRTYIINSHYDPASPFTRLAYAPLERSAALPDSSILPEQALIFMNSRMHLPLKDAWWDSMLAKLRLRKSTVQDESSLAALTQCERDHGCDLPIQRMTQAYLAALSHANPSARLLGMYGDYAWNVLDDHQLGERMTVAAIKAAPGEPAYRITLVRMLAAEGRSADAKAALQGLQTLDVGGRLETSIKQLRGLPGMN